MIKNYFKIVWRSLWNDKGFSLINIAGLVVGLVSFIFISLYIRDELTYESFREHRKDTFRLWTVLDVDGQGERSSSMAFPVGPSLLKMYPETFAKQVRFFNMQKPYVSLQTAEQAFNEPHVYFADTSAFEVMTLPLLHGDEKTALDKPHRIVISETLSKKYFGVSNSIGDTLILEGALPLIVTGILKDVPRQTHMPTDALISFPTLQTIYGDMTLKGRVWNPCWTYVILQDEVTVREAEADFQQFIDLFFVDEMSTNNATVGHLMPIEDIHLKSHLDYEIQPNGYGDNVQIFSVIALFILIIACINYMNLATSRSVKAAKEVGVRKVLGASRGQLVWRFLGESLLIAAFAVLFSIVLVEIFLPAFNLLSKKELDSSILFEAQSIWFFIGLIVWVGIVSGLYPAFYLSQFSPVKVLKGGRHPRKNRGLRKVLVLFQFSVALGLIIGTLVVNKQFIFLENQDIGFNDEEVIVIPAKWQIAKNFYKIKSEISESQHVESVTSMNEILGVKHNVHEYRHSKMNESYSYIFYPSLIVDHDFLKTFGFTLLAGRDFKDDFWDSDEAVIVNEEMVKELGFTRPEEAIGFPLSTQGGHERIVGVVEDFNFVSLSEPIRPFVFDIQGQKAQTFFLHYLVVKAKPGQVDWAIEDVRGYFAEAFPNLPFDYFLLEEEIKRSYAEQDTLRDLMTGFSIIAILIACFGLFALSAFSAEQKTKEISIRKIVGASQWQIIYIVAEDFFKVILWAILITTPLAYLFLLSWLDSFAYHISVDWISFVMAGFLGLVIAFAAIALQAYKATRVDPIVALRYE
ncbi:MAG: ABC transporter permease [Schleiferiaceae bacterium]